MSISFNHPKNTMTSTGTLNLTVSGGNTTSPQPIRFNSTSVIMPVRALPAGEAGAMVFDTGTRTMKYHDGTSWIAIESSDVILAPIYSQINTINQKLNGKVDTVSYMSGAVPQASISGTQLNITFPLSSGGGGGSNGLFTSSKQGAIQYYSLTSGMNATTIRAQMAGAGNSQTGRAGTQASPWLTNDGWVYADGMWWTWQGDSGTVTMQVPNLNRQAYLKPMDVSGITQTATIIASSGTVSATALTINQLPPHSFTVSGQTSVAGDHNHTAPVERASDGLVGPSTIRGVAWGGSPQRNMTNAGTSTNGSHIHTFTGTSETIGSGQGHTHNISNLDVSHLNVAVLYNIATPSFALNETAANGKYVLKSGDTMTGSLQIASSAVIAGNDNNITLTFRNSANAERAMIYHSSTNNTLRMRSAGGSEVTLTNAGLLTSPSLVVTNNSATVGGRNVVRSVNGSTADASGNVTITAGIQDIRLGVQVQVTTRNTAMLPAGYVCVGSHSNYNDSNWELDTMYGCPIEKQISGQWYVVNKV